MACLEGRADTVRFLLRHGTSPDHVADHCATPLLIACLKGHADIVQVLVDNGMSINHAFTPHQTTPLHIACQHGHLEVVKQLVQGRAQVDAQANGHTPLDIAPGHLLGTLGGHIPLHEVRGCT